MLSHSVSGKFVPSRNTAGFSLVELMVGIVVGTIVVAGLIAFYITIVRGAAFVTAEARLSQETRIVMDFMANDIRRAGYSHPGHLQLRENAPPINRFMEADLDLAIGNFNGGTGNCIMVSYDPTFSYQVDDAESPEWPGVAGVQFVFGYRLNEGQVEMLSDPAGDVDSTTDCDAGLWVALTDSDTTTVQALRFATDQSTSPSQCARMSNSGVIDIFDSRCNDTLSGAPGDIFLESRRVNITLEAVHSTNPESRIITDETVSVRNQRILSFEDL